MKYPFEVFADELEEDDEWVELEKPEEASPFDLFMENLETDSAWADESAEAFEDDKASQDITGKMLDLLAAWSELKDESEEIPVCASLAEKTMLNMWTRKDRESWTYRTTKSCGPPWSAAQYQSTRDCDTGEQLELMRPVHSLPRKALFAPVGGCRNLETLLYYRPDSIHNLADRDEPVRNGAVTAPHVPEQCLHHEQEPEALAGEGHFRGAAGRVRGRATQLVGGRGVLSSSSHEGGSASRLPGG